MTTIRTSAEVAEILKEEITRLNGKMSEADDANLRKFFQVSIKDATELLAQVAAAQPA